MLRYYGRLSKRFISNSWLQVYTFRFEFLMMLLHLLFSFSFILIFWYTLLSHIEFLGDWTFAELAIYTVVVQLGDSFGGIFFGFRDLPYKITRGGLDKYLCRPVNTLFAVLFESVSIIFYIEKFVTCVLLFILVVFKYNIKIQLLNLVMSLIVLIIGVLIFNFVYGTITFLAFWFGKIGVFRSIIMKLSASKEYPLTLFPKQIQAILIYIIPVAFISYYPAVILLGKKELGYSFIAKLAVLFVVTGTIFVKTWQAGIKRYEAFGG